MPIKALKFLLFLVFVSFACLAEASILNQEERLLARVFYSPTCKACHKVMEDVIPPLAEKYGEQVEWVYINITESAGLCDFVALQEKIGRKFGTPTILIGDRVLIGMTEVVDSLGHYISDELSKMHRQTLVMGGGSVNLLDRFKSFGPMTIIGAGLVDGVNPCAFTVIVFFISFLTVMGYRRREMALIGSIYIVAVFLTYLALGLGLFKAIYMMGGFYVISKSVYMIIGALSIFLGILAIKDYVIFKKTGNTDAMALQLPRPIKNKIHSIVGEYYRKDKAGRKKALFSLALSALAVGFMISILEAVCTGQLYLPTIVCVLKEGTLRARAVFYLVIYNIMFILPLVVILLAALGGATSKQFEAFARRHLGLIKIVMAVVFFVLGVVLWRGL